jgi:deazaflavin-dependent oxidoreductase (nitroreductase family)
MWYNRIVSAILRSPLHPVMSKTTLLLTYRGRRSDQQYTLPVSYVQDGATLFLLTRRQRVWWRNLRDRATATVRLRGRDLVVSADVLEDETALLAALQQMIARQPLVGRGLGVGAGTTLDTERLAVVARDLVVVRLAVPT